MRRYAMAGFALGVLVFLCADARADGAAGLAGIATGNGSISATADAVSAARKKKAKRKKAGRDGGGSRGSVNRPAVVQPADVQSNKPRP